MQAYNFMDTFTISDIKFSTLIGVHPSEQETPQTLHMDLWYGMDACKVAETDSLEHAIDYDKIMQSILTFVKEHHFKLIETLAHKLADKLFADFPVEWLGLALHKPNALLNAKQVTISVSRNRNPVIPPENP